MGKLLHKRGKNISLSCVALFQYLFVTVILMNKKSSASTPFSMLARKYISWIIIFGIQILCSSTNNHGIYRSKKQKTNIQKTEL
jgi:hypothetical protein